MLASTVQFSRNGQHRAATAHPRHDSPGLRTEDPGKAPVPSEPNSVPIQAIPPLPRSAASPEGSTYWPEEGKQPE